jgi:glycosyltransferase involved in cell wall biosynthesis
MRLREASEDNLQLSWRYPLFHGGFRLWEVKRSLGGADLIFFLNGEERRFAIDKLGVRAEHSHVVHNGLPDHLIGLPSPAEPAADEVRRLAMVGSFSQRKGVAYAVPALTAVLRDRPPVELSLLGTKIPSAEAYGAFPADVRARIHVVRSYRREELPSLLEGHQIAVSASLAEGFGKATLEAMACGLAPIATDIAGPTEFIHDGDNGVLVAPGDPDALRDAALHLLDAPAELTRLRWAAHGSAQTFGWKAVAAQRLSLYEAGLRRRGEAL